MARTYTISRRAASLRSAANRTAEPRRKASLLAELDAEVRLDRIRGALDGMPPLAPEQRETASTLAKRVAELLADAPEMTEATARRVGSILARPC